MTTWKEQLQGQMPTDWEELIDQFDNQIELRKQDKLDEKVFAETRLRRGVYGQRYDNGQRHDGVITRELDFPSDGLTKGPDTIWDAPGMQRIKLPFGGITPEQLEVSAALADEYADGILHITTRQDIQLHYVHIKDTPDLMRRLAAVGITVLEACGNSVRNITACPIAGVCRDQAFDVTPYSKALAFYLLGHDDVQDFGRKFKIAFSGCAGHACGLVRMHDLGFLAKTREVDGEVQRGFEVFVGGGLGTVPHQAKVLSEFTPEDEVLPLSQAICRVFARLGEKQNRNRARVKFLIAKIGIEEFRRLVYEEYENLPEDDRWTAYLGRLDETDEHPLKPGLFLNGTPLPEGFNTWYATNVYKQAQQGYAVVTLNLPLGDFTSTQAYQLADIARKYVGDHIRTTVEQNLVLRWVSEADLPDLYRDLLAAGLADANADTIVDITTCPGTDTCKLGIASSRGLTGELRTRLLQKIDTMPAAIKELKIKVSGCFNSCGQHHIADIGFFGNSRRKGNHKVPHFQVILGGMWEENAGSYGLAVGAVPAKAIPDTLDAIVNRYVDEREDSENFQKWVARLGRKEVKAMIQPFTHIPEYEENPFFFSDWGDSREYSINDIGVGECAGEVVSLFSMQIAKAESEHFEALVSLDEGDYVAADAKAYGAMLQAARSLVLTRFLDVGTEPESIVSEFRTRFYDTKLVYDRYAKGKFAQYLLNRYENPVVPPTEESAHRLIEEAQLFIEAIYAAEARINGVITS